MAVVIPLPAEGSSSDWGPIARIIQGGGVIAMPTESFYALGANPLDPTAIRRVWAIKGRPAGMPILVVIANRDQLATFVAAVTPAAEALIERFWPGPLTVILPAASRVPEALTAGTGTVGVRLTAARVLARLLHAVGPLTGTSANRSGAPPARSAEEVQTTLGSDVDLIVDGGSTYGGQPSTVVDAVGPVRVIRDGPISRAQIAAALAGAGLALAS
ncbi:MAG: L-threonylcarbamoyladenylate synthase [Candidatus Methylomirabilales bacterium]